MRRIGLAVVVVISVLATLDVQAQESIPRPRVAFLGAESASTNEHFLDAFRQGLREHGYVNGQNLTLEARWAEGRSERFAVGQTTHRAARMEQMATPSTILLTPATLRLVEGYVQVVARGPVAVKGLPDPMDVYALTGASAQRTRLHAATARGLTRFVGRDAELEQIRRVTPSSRSMRRTAT
jgi:hypothetical protein